MHRPLDAGPMADVLDESFTRKVCINHGFVSQIFYSGEKKKRLHVQK